ITVRPTNQANCIQSKLNHQPIITKYTTRTAKCTLLGVNPVDSGCLSGSALSVITCGMRFVIHKLSGKPITVRLHSHAPINHNWLSQQPTITNHAARARNGTLGYIGCGVAGIVPATLYTLVVA